MEMLYPRREAKMPLQADKYKPFFTSHPRAMDFCLVLYKRPSDGLEGVWITCSGSLFRTTSCTFYRETPLVDGVELVVSRVFVLVQFLIVSRAVIVS